MENIQDLNSEERRLMQRAGQLSVPINGSMELLPLCNMSCDMCYVRLSRQEMEAQGRMRSGAEWLALGREMVKAGTLFLLLTGGEPLLHPDFRDIYLGLKKMGMVLTINTNGTLIDEEWAEFFGKYKSRRINITLYGGDDTAYRNLCHHPGGFDRVIHGVKLLRQQGVDVKLAGSLTRSNAADVSRMVQLARELDVPLHMDPYMMPAVRERRRPFAEQSRLMPEQAAKACVGFVRDMLTPEAFAQYRAQKLEQVDAFEPKPEVPCEGSCMAGRCSFTVNWQGQIRPCVVMTEPAVDVFEVGFEAGWKQVSKEFQAVRYCPKCSACRLRPLCRSCAAAALLETGDYMGTPEYLCRYAGETERLLRETEK